MIQNMNLLSKIVMVVEKIATGEITVSLEAIKEKLFIKYVEMEKKFTKYEIRSDILNSVRVLCETQYTLASHIYEHRVSEAMTVAKILEDEDAVLEVLSLIEHTKSMVECFVEERTIDDSGKIIIPKKFREALNLSAGDNVQIELVNETLVIKKRNNSFKNAKLINALLNSIDIPDGMGVAVCDLNNIIAEKSVYTKNCNKTLNCALNSYLKDLIVGTHFMTGTDNAMTGFEENSVYVTERNKNICANSIYVINPDKGAVVLFYKKGNNKKVSANVEEVLKYISVLLRDY